MSFFEAVASYIDKARSRVYGIFLFWIVAIHAPVIFTSLFVDQDIIYKKTGLLKNEYMRNQFFGYTDWWMWLAYVVVVLVLSGTMTWLMIWILPKTLVKIAYQQELDDQYEREFMKIEKEEDLNKKRKHF